MRAPDTATALARFDGRGAGTDAERRAARWLAKEIEATGRSTRLEPFWCRPNWPLAHAWHIALALAGSLVSVGSPRIGGAMLVVALVSVLTDELTGVSLGRRLTPERASQNVIGFPRVDPAPDAVRLIITANYDAGRTGLVYRGRVRRPLAALHNAFGRFAPGWLGWLTIAIAWLLVLAVLRLEGQRGAPIGALALVPTVALVLALALALELGTSSFGPAANDNASGTALALALAAALDAGVTGRLAIELVLQGAGDQGALGLRRYLRARRKERRAHNTVVLGIAPCGAGALRWYRSDGPLVPLRYFARLQTLCAALARQQPQLDARAIRGRGTTPALPGRAARLPAISVGCLDERGLVPRSHTAQDIPTALSAEAMDLTLQFGLMLVDEIDGYLAEQARGRNTAPKPEPAPVRPA